MPDPGFTRPDLCSIPAADAEAEPAGAARGGLSADGQPPPGDDLPAPSPRRARPGARRVPVSARRRAPRDQPSRSADGGRAMTALATSAGGSHAPQRHRPRHPPVYRGGRARRGGHCGVCLLPARLRGRPGPRRDRDHRPAGRRPRSTAWSTPVRWWCCTRRGTGCRYPPWPAGCSRWESPRPSRRTWHRAGRTAPSGR